jgi:tetratricopeptide (TPR) repeat protein
LRDLKSSAIAYRNMAILLTNGGQRKEAEEAFATSLCLLRRRAAEFPEIPGCLEDLAIGCNMLGCWLPGGEKDNQRTQLIRESIKIFENLAAEYPDNSSYPFVLADWNLGLAEILMSSNCQQQGEEAYRKSFKQFVTLPDQYLTPPERRAIVNRAFNGLSSLLKATGRTHEAQEITQQAIDLYKKLVKSQPIDLRLKQELAKYYVKLAVLLRASSKLEEAAQAFRAAREIYERDLAADFLVKNADANELYNAACVLALAADRRDETGGSLSREQCAQRAIAILQQAVANGWKDAEHMKKDDDLKALRGREDFRKLLAELEKTVERKDEADPKLPAEKK